MRTLLFTFVSLVALCASGTAYAMLHMLPLCFTRVPLVGKYLFRFADQSSWTALLLLNSVRTIRNRRKY